MIDIYWRGTGEDWPDNRPDIVETMHESEVQGYVVMLRAHGAEVTRTETVSWQTSLARMENSFEL